MSLSTPGTRTRKRLLELCRSINGTMRIITGVLYDVGKVYDIDAPSRWRKRKLSEYPENDIEQLRQLVRWFDRVESELSEARKLVRQRIWNITEGAGRAK